MPQSRGRLQVGVIMNAADPAHFQIIGRGTGPHDGSTGDGRRTRLNEPMSDSGRLVDFLAARTPEQLAGILRRRPDTTWGAPIADLADLAERLSSAVSLQRALQAVPEPCLQLCHGIVALGPSTTLPALLGLLTDAGDPTDRDAAVIVQLDRLTDLVAVWPDGDRLRHDPALDDLIPRPMGIGQPVASWLARLSRAEAAAMAGACGLPTSGSRAAVTGRLVALLTDAEQVRAMVNGAPAPARRQLEVLATTQSGGEPAPRRDRGALEGESWARRRGLVFDGEYYAPEVPAEVVLAIMGPRTRLPFAPRPPGYVAHAVPAGAIDRGAAAAAAEATQSVAALIDRLGRTPAAALKAGGVGSRELLKIGKALGVDESHVRFDLELLRDLGVLAGTGDGVGVAAPAASWRAAEPGDRYADLVAIWWTLPVHPTIGRDSDGKVLPAIGRRPADGAAAFLRDAALRLIDELGAERAVGDAPALAGQLAWHRPLTAPDGPSVEAFWREAHAIGVLVDGALSPVGRCLLDGDADELLAVAAGLLPAASSSGRFGSDLTVLVAGSPSASVSVLLDTCADREGRGAAVVWRFCPTSVRRAFDEGWTADELTSALRGLLDPAVAADLPQTLTYLIADVARRHGHLVVLPAASCVRSTDPALLREVVADRRVQHLHPHPVTDEVVVFQHPPAAVVEALRAAGYLPVPADEHGVVQLHRTTTPHERPGVGEAGDRPLDRLTTVSPATGLPDRGPDARSSAADRPDHGTDDALAGRLLRLTDTGDQDGPRTASEEYIDMFAPQLRPLERRQLAFAIDRQLPVIITYETASGGVSRRLISDLELIGDHLYAWCHLRDDQREFNVARILDVHPARR